MFSHKAFLKLGEYTGSDFMSLAKEGYELANFEFSFQQGIDDKGKATTEVFGGAISLTLPMLPTKEIIDWALNSYRYRNGTIVTLDANDEPTSKVSFNKATCTSLVLTYSQKGKSYMSTSIIIQAEELRVGNNVEFSNNWVR